LLEKARVEPIEIPAGFQPHSQKSLKLNAHPGSRGARSD
jgi:hypothetical protein